ncbi:MAG TPA: flagellar basal body-associated FliL family protein [Chthonomonadaceae bacterium]|nr:flagellar basal body-associated FliL family protein [Chthonomonadaceae bacterium]
MITRQAGEPIRVKRRRSRAEQRLIWALILGVLFVLVLVTKNMLGLTNLERNILATIGNGSGSDSSYPLDEFLVNLRGGGDHYLRTTIALGLRPGVPDDQVKEKLAPIRDAIVTTLTAKTLSDLSSPEGKETLKNELRIRINSAVAENIVDKIYLMSFATQ